MTRMTDWNIIFDILEPPPFKKYSICYNREGFKNPSHEQFLCLTEFVRDWVFEVTPYQLLVD